jgi:hypothetical protein
MEDGSKHQVSSKSEIGFDAKVKSIEDSVSAWSK